MSECNNKKEVFYAEYCGTCKHYMEPETCEKCNDCLNQPYNYDSHKPINYERDEKA